MTTERSQRPIFVHASPRCGSTYFFNALRRVDGLLCFNEAIIDIFSAHTKREVANYTGRQTWNVNHAFFSQQGDFDEFVEAWDKVMPLLPSFPSFRDYVPANGAIADDLRAYIAALIEHARLKGKRAALCEIHSRGRAGALRDAFGGFHVAQIRDPLSQFGSYYRPLEEGGAWNYLIFPLKELGISGDRALYQIVPERWRVPILPWPADDRAQRWSTAVQYNVMVASPRPDAIERAFRWHLFSWLLGNLAAIAYSDYVLDLDEAYDDAAARQSVVDAFSAETGHALDLSDLTKFSRYYRFEAFDAAAVCGEAAATIRAALDDGRLDAAVRGLSRGAPTVPVDAAADILFRKLDELIKLMTTSPKPRIISNQDWAETARRHRLIWESDMLRGIAQRIYPLAAPLARAARKAGMLR